MQETHGGAPTGWHGAGQQRIVKPPPNERYKPKVTVSMVTKLLSGEAQCEWALWFQWKYDVPDGPDTPERIEWRRKHDALVEKRVAELEEAGCTVTVERENRLASKSSKSRSEIKGRPDIVIHGPELRTFEDCKAGRKKLADHYQILMYAILTGWKRLHDPNKMNGTVVYEDETEPVNMALMDQTRERFLALMNRVTAGTVPRIPSEEDCKYCAARAYCPERFEERQTDFHDSWIDGRR